MKQDTKHTVNGYRMVVKEMHFENAVVRKQLPDFLLSLHCFFAADP